MSLIRTLDESHRTLALTGGLPYSRAMVDTASRFLPFHRIAVRRISVVFMLVGIMTIPGNLFFINYAYAAKQGQSCTKAGLKNGSLVCTKVNGKLIWRPAKKPRPVPISSPTKAPSTVSIPRVASDQPDTVVGFQVKAIYVVPSDGVDHSYDKNGYIAGILDEGNRYLSGQLGLTLPIDKNSSGYDIQYLKSNLSTAYLTTAQDLPDRLLAESRALENPGMNRKDYIFFVDVNGLTGGTACGVSNTPGISAAVAIGKGVNAIGNTCAGKNRNFDNYATGTWVHELFHNFGVEHTFDDPCDLMKAAEALGTCSSSGQITIDKTKSRYVGSSVQGQNILNLRVWAGKTDRLDLEANCSRDPVARADGFHYAYCPTGTQTIGALQFCLSPISSVTLEEFVAGQWKSLGSGSSSSEPWGPNLGFKCGPGSTAPSMQVTVTSPGISLYRWMVNAQELEQIKVIWVR